MASGVEAWYCRRRGDRRRGLRLVGRWCLYRGLSVIGGRQVGDLRLRWADYGAFGNVRRLGDLGGYCASCNGRRAVLRRFKALLDRAAKNRRLAV